MCSTRGVKKKSEQKNLKQKLKLKLSSEQRDIVHCGTHNRFLPPREESAKALFPLQPSAPLLTSGFFDLGKPRRTVVEAKREFPCSGLRERD